MPGTIGCIKLHSVHDAVDREHAVVIRVMYGGVGQLLLLLSQIQLRQTLYGYKRLLNFMYSTLVWLCQKYIVCLIFGMF